MNSHRKTCIICEKPLKKKTKQTKLERVTCSRECSRIYTRIYHRIREHKAVNFLEESETKRHLEQIKKYKLEGYKSENNPQLKCLNLSTSGLKKDS